MRIYNSSETFYRYVRFLQIRVRLDTQQTNHKNITTDSSLRYLAVI